MMSGLLRWMCVLALAGALGACGDDSSSDSDSGVGESNGDGDGDSTPEPISEEISADEGGEIETQGATISIPGGALEDDTEITVEVILASAVPNAENVASLIYDFGPDGTTFSEPVELTIALNTDIPEGMQAQMAWLDEETDTWMPLADSRVEGEEVIATTDHFTMFAIVIKASGQTEGMCMDFADFEACGGDIEGTWEFSLACADFNPFSGEDNPFGDCPDLAVTFNIDISGSITFGSDGTFSSELMRSGDFGLSVPVSCLETLGAPCEQVFARDPEDPEDMTSAEVVDGVCEVSMPQADVTDENMGTYELEGNTLITQSSDQAEPQEPEQYCVQGNTITVRSVDVDEDTGEETVTFFQAIRQ